MSPNQSNLPLEIFQSQMRLLALPAPMRNLSPLFASSSLETMVAFRLSAIWSNVLESPPISSFDVVPTRYSRLPPPISSAPAASFRTDNLGTLPIFFVFPPFYKIPHFIPL